MDGGISIFGARQADDINVVAVTGEPKIGCGIWLGILIVSESSLDLGRALSESFPGGGRVDGFAILLEPGSDIEKNRLHFIGNCAVRPRSDIE